MDPSHFTFISQPHTHNWHPHAMFLVCLNTKIIVDHSLGTPKICLRDCCTTVHNTVLHYSTIYLEGVCLNLLPRSTTLPSTIVDQHTDIPPV